MPKAISRVVAATIVASAATSGQSAPTGSDLNATINNFSYNAGALYRLQRGCGIPNAERLRPELASVLSGLLAAESVELGLKRFDIEFNMMGGERNLRCDRKAMHSLQKRYEEVKEMLLRLQR